MLKRTINAEFRILNSLKLKFQEHQSTSGKVGVLTCLLSQIIGKQSFLENMMFKLAIRNAMRETGAPTSSSVKVIKLEYVILMEKDVRNLMINISITIKNL